MKLSTKASGRALVGAVLAASSLSLGLGLSTPTAKAAAPQVMSDSVTSPGPLNKITVTPDLNCGVWHRLDSHGEWYDDLACGTFVAVGGHLYGPAHIPPGWNVIGAPGYVAYRAISQSTSGSGTASSPFKITTKVALGSSGITLTETDTYTVGQESYQTNVSLTNAGGTKSAIIYRAGDCFLQDDDHGYGGLQPGGSPTCLAQPDSANPNRVLGLRPLTSGSRYLEAKFYDMWTAVGSQRSLPNTIQSGEHDNAIAVSWAKSLRSGSTTSVSSLAFFSPLGHSPVTVAVGSNPGTVAPNGTVVYTVSATNPGAITENLATVTANLPAGYTYVPGSTRGATTANPVVNGNTLTWRNVSVPAGSANGATTVSITFQAKAGSQGGSTAATITVNCSNSCTVVGSSAPVTPATRTYNYLVQVDRYNPIVKGNASATAYLKKLVASLDNDGVLKHREDVGICGPSATCLRYRTQVQFVNVTINSATTPTKAQIIAKVNAATSAKIGDIHQTSKVSTVTGPITMAWILDTAHGASVQRPWGARYNLVQTYLGRQ